jgi:erythromycin esterase-like protein
VAGPLTLPQGEPAGFTTCTGTVMAATEWGGPAERKPVRPAMAGSYEALLHDAHIPAFLLCPLAAGDVSHALQEPRLERAIGVIYRPQTERQSPWADWYLREPPETYPTSL